MERLKLTLFVKDEFKLFNPDEFVDDEKLSGEVAYQYEKNAKKNSEISICSDNSTEVTINLSGRYCKLTMNSLTFHKRVYQPCEISAVINIIVSDSSRSLIPRQNIISALKDVKVKLENVRDVETDSTKTVTEVIAENYYVHEVLTTYYSSGRSIEASLRIFSLDKKLTFDKFCRAYTAKKLYTDILKADTYKMLSEYGISVNDKTELQFLSYERTTTLNTQNDTKDKSLPSTQMCEFIQPYLVQYNESYYDFLVRTANRCGEFFFFEDGKICLGLTQTDSSSAKRITTFESITYRDITEGTKEIEDYHHNGTYDVVPKDVTEYANAKTDYTTSEFAYNFEVPVDDYITVFHKDEFADWNSEYVRSWMSKSFSWVNLLLNSSSYKTLLTKLALGEVVSLAMTPSAINKKNEKGNEKNIFDMPAEQRIESAISGINEDGSKAQSASPFTSLIHSSEVKKDYKKNLTTLFYKTVKEKEIKVSSEAVEVDLGVDFMDIKLGDLVRLTDDDKVYVAIEVKGKSGVSNLGTETNFSVLLIPVLLESETEVYTDALEDAKKDISADLKSRIEKEEKALKLAQEKVEAEAHAQTLAEAKAEALAVSEELDEIQEKVKDCTEALADAETKVEICAKQYVNAKAKVKTNPEIYDKTFDDADAKVQELGVKSESKMSDEELFAEISEDDESKYMPIISGPQHQSMHKTKPEFIERASEFNALAKANALLSACADVEAKAKAKADADAKMESLVKELEKNQADAQEHARLRAIYQADVEAHAEALAELQAELEAEADAKAQNKTKIKKDTITIICPPLCDFPSICSSAPQLAVVGDSSDPKGLGRVRIRYPWQTKDADMSPWIRLATPFATQGGGIFFNPVVGDEVLVDYDGGNIERPYVVGSLYTGKSQVPNGTRVISSANGHSIKMTDPAGADSFIGNLWGGWSLLQSVVPNLKDIIPEANGVAGGIELTDRYGIYSVKMSSSNRKVSVSSPFGDVSIDAFTGIKLSAPNGKIVIQAKDIEISAGNNISITSGENLPDVLTQMELEDESERAKKQMGKIDRIKLFFKELYDKIPGYGEIAAMLVSTFFEQMEGGIGKSVGAGIADAITGKLVDLRLLRTIMEVYLRPSAGTLNLKSWRFMQLEAGRGRARIPNYGYTHSGLKYNINKEHEQLIRLYEVTKELHGFVDKWLDKLVSLFNTAVNTRNFTLKFLKYYTKPEDKLDSEWTDDSVEDFVNTMVKDILSGKKKKYKESDFVFYKDYESMSKSTIKATSYLVEDILAVKEWAMKPEDNIVKWFRSIHKEGNLIVECVEDIELSHVAYPITMAIVEGTETFKTQTKLDKIPKDQIKLVKRKLVCTYVKKTQLLDSEHMITKDGDFINDEKWIDFVNTLKKKTKVELKKNLKGATKDFLMDALAGFEEGSLNYLSIPGWVKTRDVWGPEKEGEILFSDKSGYTISFKGGHLSHVENDSEMAYIENIKRVLKDIN